jgi:hypothetical protein
MSRKSLVNKSIEKPSVKEDSREILRSENMTDSLGSIREDHPKSQINLIDRLIEKEISFCSEQLNVDSEELKVWITLQTGAPAKSVLHALRTAGQYRLDPLQEEVLLIQYQEVWQVSISADGWIKIINRHPSFTGLTFIQSPEEIDGLPIWMECTIHRSDRVIPITIREHLTEVRSDLDIWQRMPRRILRHRALQQCARIAFGISSREVRQDSFEALNTSLNQAHSFTLKTKNKTTFSQIEKLKNILN